MTRRGRVAGGGSEVRQSPAHPIGSNDQVPLERRKRAKKMAHFVWEKWHPVQTPYKIVPSQSLSCTLTVARRFQAQKGSVDICEGERRV